MEFDGNEIWPRSRSDIELDAPNEKKVELLAFTAIAEAMEIGTGHELGAT